MCKLKKTSLIWFAVFALFACNQAPQNSITISGAWIREAPPNASAMAGYLQIQNAKDQKTALVSASSDSFKTIEFHRSVEKDGVYRMIRHETLSIPANGTLELKPGDYHLMLISPKKNLKEGDSAIINLSFENGSTATLEIPVKKAKF